MSRRHKSGRLIPVLLFLCLGLLSWSGAGRGSDEVWVRLETCVFDPLTGGEPELAEELRAPETAGAHLALLQLTGPILPQWRSEIETLGATIHEYVPDVTYLVTLDAKVEERLKRLSFVRWIGAYHPAYRISPHIGRMELIDPQRRGDPRRTLIAQVIGDPQAAALEVEALGIEVLETVADPWSPRLVVKALPEDIPHLARLTWIWWIEEKPDTFVLNNTTRWVVQSNVSGSMPVWNHGLHGEDEIVTMMDTGLDYNSCWFRSAGNAPPGPTHRKVIDYTTWGGSPYDGCGTGHGTHVAGTCVGDQSYINPGNINYNGMAYAAKITVQDVGNDDFFSCLFGLLFVPSSLNAPLSAAYNLGARVHTNSWGSTSTSYDSYARDVDVFMWGHKDFLAVYAAGNSGPGSGTVGSPATAKDCVTAGATRQAPQQETVAGYSSRGPTDDNRYKPTVMAPGGESPTYIYSADNDSGNPPSPTCNVQGNPFQGTSMATPAVSGCALPVRQYYREGWYPSGTPRGEDAFLPSAALVKATLVNSAADMGSADIPNNNEGWGRLLLEDALYFDGDARELRIEEETAGLQTGAEDLYVYDVEAGQPLEIVLVWTDYPAATGGGVKLVNDLDLEVEAPGGTIYRGNVFSGGQSSSGGSADRRNVEEVVRRNAPVAGAYAIRVKGYNVPQGGSQPYALVSTGAFGAWPPAGASVPVVSGPYRAAGLVVRPNPSGSATEITWRIPATLLESQLVVAIYDLAGRRVRVLADELARETAATRIWDGRDARGRPVPGGMYFATLRAGDLAVEEKVVVLR